MKGKMKSNKSSDIHSALRHALIEMLFSFVAPKLKNNSAVDVEKEEGKKGS